MSNEFGHQNGGRVTLCRSWSRSVALTTSNTFGTAEQEYPGAAGKYGIHKVITMLRFNIDGKEIKDLEIIELPKN